MTDIDVSNEKGLATLDQQLLAKSYVDGYVPSKNDAAVFGKFTTAPAEKYFNALRWYKHISSFSQEERSKWGEAVAAAKQEEKPAAGGDEDLDLFGDDEETEEEKKDRERREKEASEKKKSGKKEEKAAKSSVVLAIKPWEAETDLALLEKKIREIEMNGLTIGGSKTEEIGFGIKKLLINFIVLDDLCSVDDLQEKIQSFEDLVQSTDIEAFNKVG